jgi:hypothetical protein
VTHEKMVVFKTDRPIRREAILEPDTDGTAPARRRFSWRPLSFMQTAPAQRVGWGRMRRLCRWGWSIGTATQCSQGKLVPKQSVPIGQEECPN